MKTLNKLTLFIQQNKWYLVSTLWITGLVLGYAGFTSYAFREGLTLSWLDKIYMTIQLIVLESGTVSAPPPALDAARFILPIMTAQTSLMALAIIFAKELRRFTLRFAKNHVIVCGDGDLAIFAARTILQGKERVVLVTNDINRDELNSFEQQGGAVIEGNLTQINLTKRVALHKASYLLLFHDDDHQNVKNALLAEKIVLPNHKGILHSITHLNDPLLSSLFLEQTLKAEWKQNIQHDVINIYEQSARQFLKKFPAIQTGITQQPEPILIIGFGRFGQHVLLETAREFLSHGLHATLTMHVLDNEADWKCTALHKRYRQLEKVCCVIPHQIDIFSPEFQDVEHFISTQCPGVIKIYICLSDDRLAINTALTIYRQMRQKTPQIILRLSTAKGLEDIFKYAEQIEQIKTMSVFDEIGTPAVLLNSSIELLARAFHDHYRKQRRIEETSSPTLMEWLELPEEKKESNRNLARYLKLHLESIHYHLLPCQDLTTDVVSFTEDEIDFLARKEHERWIREMKARGWQYGLVNDPVKKTNPDLQAWENLTGEEKQFNRDFMKVIPELVSYARLQIAPILQSKPKTDQTTIRIGISGHRHLRDQYELTQAISEGFEIILNKHPEQKLLCYSALAAGADQVAAQVALEKSIPLVVLVPFEEKQYLDDFSQEERQEFMRLSQRAEEIIRLPDIDREQAYNKLSEYLVEKTDTLLAVWNGQPARGAGGTGDVVERFRRKGKPLVWVRADNMLPEEPVLLPPGLAQGSIVYENW